MRSAKRDCPLITVVTLSYNSVHLEDTIESVLIQDYPTIQYIIADDGSVDFDAAGVREFIEHNQRGNVVDLIVTHSNENKGTVRNYNEALLMAKGAFIFPLSADDVFTSAHVLTRWERAFEKSGVPVFCACCDNYDETLTHFRGRWPKPSHIRIINGSDSGALYKLNEKTKVFPGCTMARTLDSITELGLFDTDYLLLEDYPFIMRTLRKGVAIRIWPHSAIKRRAGGVSDNYDENSLIRQDMARFKEKEIYPYCDNCDDLRRAFDDAEQSGLAKKVFDQKWEQGSVLEKLALLISNPIQCAKRAYHQLFRI